MSITRKAPNTIQLAGQGTLINTVHASAAITPGMLIERHNSSGEKFRAHSTAAGFANVIFALDQGEMNKGIADAYAAGDLVKALKPWPGSIIYALIASGENITVSNFLESAGDGTLKVYGSGVRVAQALESVDNSAGPSHARIRVETL